MLWSRIILVAISGVLAVTGTLLAESPTSKELQHEKTIAEAESLYKAKKYSQSLAVFEKSDPKFPWTINLLFAKRERLVAMNLLRLKRYDEAENANLRAYEVDPRLTDAIYDSACAASLAKNADSAILYLRVLWLTVREQPTVLARYAAAVRRDKDLAFAARTPQFKVLLDEYTTGKVHPSRPIVTDPSTFMVVGDNVEGGYSSHGLMAMKMCPEMPEKDGIILAGPKHILIKNSRKQASNPLLRLPICFSHMISSATIRDAKKRNPAASFEMKISVRREGDPTVYSGSYNPLLNNFDLRTGRVLEDPAPDPSDSSGQTDDKADFSTGGREVTDVVWHVPGVAANPKNPTSKRGSDVYRILLQSDAQKSNEVTVMVEFE